MPKYEVVAGKHYHRDASGAEIKIDAGGVVDLSHEEAAKWPGKFRLLPEAPKEEVKAKPQAAQASVQPQPGKK